MMMITMMMILLTPVGHIWRSDTVSVEATDWKLKAAHHPSSYAIILQDGDDVCDDDDDDDDIGIIVTNIFSTPHTFPHYTL